MIKEMRIIKNNTPFTDADKHHLGEILNYIPIPGDKGWIISEGYIYGDLFKTDADKNTYVIRWDGTTQCVAHRDHYFLMTCCEDLTINRYEKPKSFQDVKWLIVSGGLIGFGLGALITIIGI